MKRGELHPITQQVIESGKNYSALDVFKSQYRLMELRKKVDTVWDKIDILVTPTIGTSYTINELLEEPLQLNTNYGFYTNFVNLLDLCGVAVPAGIVSTKKLSQKSSDDNGIPFGITLLAPRYHEVCFVACGSCV